FHRRPCRGARIVVQRWPQAQTQPIVDQSSASPRSSNVCCQSLSYAREGGPVNEMLAAHWQVDRYGSFQLTEAIRPGPGLQVVPREGSRIDVFRDKVLSLHVPVLAAAVSRDKLFDVFLDLLGLLGPTVDVVLETSHQNVGGGHRDLFREQIDLPVL